MNTYRFILERYRGISTRYTCPQCGRKHTFTRYIDTENNNQYLSERVGECNRLDKCGYHYTPREYFADNPWLREKSDACPFVQIHRVNEQMNMNKPTPRPICILPGWGGKTKKFTLRFLHYRYLSPVEYLRSSIKLLIFCSSLEGQISSTSGVSTTI